MKNFLKDIGIALVITFILPVIAVKFISADAGMAVCFMLFFALNPATSCIIGIVSGRNVKKNWYLILIMPIFFLAFSNVIFVVDSAFIIYSIIYLVLGVIFMGTTAFIKKRYKIS